MKAKRSLENYLLALERMKRSPRDRVGVLGELAAGGLGTAAGVGLAGSVAALFGGTTLLGSTTLASVLGGVFVTTTPVGWVVGAAVAGGSLAYGAARMIRSGARIDAVKDLNIRELEARIERLRREAAGLSVRDDQFPKIITGIQCLVANGHMTQVKGREVLQAVQDRRMTVDQGFGFIEGLLAERAALQESSTE